MNRFSKCLNVKVANKNANWTSYQALKSVCEPLWCSSSHDRYKHLLKDYPEEQIRALCDPNWLEVADRGRQVSDQQVGLTCHACIRTY